MILKLNTPTSKNSFYLEGIYFHGKIEEQITKLFSNSIPKEIESMNKFKPGINKMNIYGIKCISYLFLENNILKGYIVDYNDFTANKLALSMLDQNK